MDATESLFVEVPERREETHGTEIVQAEFVEASAIRRAPVGASAQRAATPRVSMDLERWLEVDRQLHELYSLVEIAILQRDEARASADAAESLRDVMSTRLREWKTYARSLEERLHTSQIENLELSFALKGSVEIAKEAIAAPRFARARRKQLRERLTAIGDDLGY